MKTLLLDDIRLCLDARTAGELNATAVGAVSTDSRALGEGDLFFAIRGDRFDGHDFVADAFTAGAGAAVVDHIPPNVSDDCRSRILIVDDTVRGLGALAASYRQTLACPVIAVTGSTGKTTTKEMIYHILSKHFRGRRSEKSFNNHIGVPLTLLSAEPGDEFLVVEAGTNHPGELNALGDLIQPDVALITMIGECHLEGFGDLDHVAIEKADLAKHTRNGGAIMFNGDCDRLARRIDHPDATVVRFGTSETNDLRLTDVHANRAAVRFVVNDRFSFALPVPGRHNALNALAAIAVARRLGVDMDQIADDLRDYALPPMRLAVERIGELTVLNDAYNANPVSMYAAVQTLRDIAGSVRKVFFCGDMLELGAESETYHRQLGERVARDVDILLTVGDQTQATAEAAMAAGLAKKNVRCYAHVEQAKAHVSRIVRPGDAILIKGSRAIGMDALVAALRETLKKTNVKRR